MEVCDPDRTYEWIYGAVQDNAIPDTSITMVRRSPSENTFWSAIKDIRQLAAQRMTERERRKFQLQERVVKGKPVKGPKIPYNLLQALKRKEREQARIQREDAKQSGMWRKPIKNSNKRPSRRR